MEAPVKDAMAIWERFMATGELEPGLLRPEIEASWLRCRAAGVDPHAGRSTRALDPEALARLKERKRALIEVAKPFMQDLFNLVAGTGFVVLLLDEYGTLLETVAEPEWILAYDDLNLAPGACWTEDEVGTNGVGTSLVLGRTFQVSGPEHFCRKHHKWTCTGAPILDRNGETTGLLELSGPVGGTHLHTQGLVMASVAAIQHQLELGRKNLELMLLNKRLASILGTVSDGVIVLAADGTLAQANPVAERLLGVTSRQMAGKWAADLVREAAPIQDLLAWGREFLDQEMELQSCRGAIQCLVSGRPILDDEGVIQGAVLFANPILKIKRLVNRFAGAQATFRFEDVLGHGEAIRKAVHLGHMAAGNDSNVMLAGESGTGKELFAQAIHNQSARRNGPFVAVNCGAIPRELIASELFGYHEGAFTGAARGGRPGKFELASGGTLFLDEIGDMPLEQQIALLRVLQDRTITRIGGDKSLVVDVRIICATHKDLREEVRKGTFRQDLYYRLNVSMIKLPPLREHTEDIPELLESFVRKLTATKKGPALGIDPQVVQVFRRHPWPGNIREFQNVVERMVHAAQGPVLSVEQIPEELQGPPETLPGTPRPAMPLGASGLRSLFAAEEQQEILACLRACKGNLSQAARKLGMGRTTLYRKLEKLGFPDGSPTPEA
jgi:transcriptional regulator of acetoin/glycerol metabolism